MKLKGSEFKSTEAIVETGSQKGQDEEREQWTGRFDFILSILGYAGQLQCFWRPVRHFDSLFVYSRPCLLRNGRGKRRGVFMNRIGLWHLNNILRLNTRSKFQDFHSIFRGNKQFKSTKLQTNQPTNQSQNENIHRWNHHRHHCHHWTR